MSFLFAIFILVVSSKLSPLHLSRSENTIKDQFIVVFKKEITSLIYQNQITIAKAGLKVGHTYEHAFKGFSAELDADQLLKLRTNPFVDYIEGDQVISLAQSTCSSQLAGSWGLTRISQRKINIDGTYYASSTEGEGVNAYVLDTGVRITHDEFANGRATFGFKAEVGWSNTDGNGHGTHVASTIAGVNYGVAKKASIIAVKVLADSGSGSFAGIIAGIDYVIGQHRNGTKSSVANLSIGGSKSTAVNQAVNQAAAAGVVMVVAAGNENDDACNYSPASAADAITVGATNIGVNGDVRSYFSNYGKCVDILAPGSDIKGAWFTNDRATNVISGTSMASPHVCGAAALLLSDSAVNIPPAKVKEDLNSRSSKNDIDLLCSMSKPGKQLECDVTPNTILFNGCSV